MKTIKLDEIKTSFILDCSDCGVVLPETAELHQTKKTGAEYILPKSVDWDTYFQNLKAGKLPRNFFAFKNSSGRWILFIFTKNIRTTDIEEYSTTPKKEVEQTAPKTTSLAETDVSGITLKSNSVGKYEMLPTQIHNVKIAKKLGWRLAIGDEMGLGKTIQALAIANESDAKTILIVSPKTAKSMWRQKVSECFPKTEKIFIFTHYEELAKTQKLKIDLLIVDEAHYCKSVIGTRKINGKPTTAIPLRTLGVLEQARLSKYVVLLSGTLMPNRISEIFSYTQILSPQAPINDIKENYYKFMHEFFYKTSFGYSENPKASKQNEIINIYNSFITRFDFENKLNSYKLPDKNDDRFNDIVSNDKELKALIDLLLEKADKLNLPPNELLNHLNNTSEGEDGMGVLQKYRILSEKSKLPKVIQDAEDIIASGEKVVIFSYSRECQKTLNDYFKLRVKTAYIHSALTPDERFEQAEEFQNDTETKIMVCSLGCGREALTLTSASHVLFAGLDWVPATMQQAEGRIRRIGQTKRTTAHFYSVSQIDTMMFDCLARKEKNLTKFYATV